MTLHDNCVTIVSGSSSDSSPNGADDSYRSWYAKTIEYWSRQEASVSGVLAGYASVSPYDLQASLTFLDRCHELTNCGLSVALDCGSGIGRVTEGCLLKRFQKVDLVEPVEHLLAKAASRFAASGRVERAIQASLQDFAPARDRYDCIWIQWCLLYLVDRDLVDFLKRCKSVLRPNGIIVVKENVGAPKECPIIDLEDNSVLRPVKQYLKLFKKAGLAPVTRMRQPTGFIIPSDAGCSRLPNDSSLTGGEFVQRHRGVCDCGAAAFSSDQDSLTAYPTEICDIEMFCLQ